LFQAFTVKKAKDTGADEPIIFEAGGIEVRARPEA